MASKKPGKKQNQSPNQVDAVGLRIIGGRLRGSKLTYAGDRRVRPMKDRVREATFNLIHSSVAGAFAVDLFGGTGALGLEAISRGAVGALFTEQHFPTARVLRQNIQTLGVEAQATLLTGDVFLTYRKNPPLPTEVRWVVFCSPPYRFFNERTEDLYQLLEPLMQRAPAGSLFVAESDTTFDWSRFDALGPWDIRAYPPAVLGIHQKE